MQQVLIGLLLLSTLTGCATAIVAGTVGTAMVVNDRRTMGTQIDDQSIENTINAALNQHDELKYQARIRVISMNRQVLLVGQVPNQALREQALQIVQDLRGIDLVHDKLQQGSPLGMNARSTDGWITTKIKSQMLAENQLNSMRIKVVTENSEVFLLGVVNEQEADLAVNIARYTEGVRRVVKVFEYY